MIIQRIPVLYPGSYKCNQIFWKITSRSPKAIRTIISICPEYSPDNKPAKVISPILLGIMIRNKLCPDANQLSLKIKDYYFMLEFDRYGLSRTWTQKETTNHKETSFKKLNPELFSKNELRTCLIKKSHGNPESSIPKRNIAAVLLLIVCQLIFVFQITKINTLKTVYLSLMIKNYINKPRDLFFKNLDEMVNSSPIHVTNTNYKTRLIYSDISTVARSLPSHSRLNGISISDDIITASITGGNPFMQPENYSHAYPYQIEVSNFKGAVFEDGKMLENSRYSMQFSFLPQNNEKQTP